MVRNIEKFSKIKVKLFPCDNRTDVATDANFSEGIRHSPYVFLKTPGGGGGCCNDISAQLPKVYFRRPPRGVSSLAGICWLEKELVGCWTPSRVPPAYENPPKNRPKQKNFEGTL